MNVVDILAFKIWWPALKNLFSKKKVMFELVIALLVNWFIHPATAMAVAAPLFQLIACAIVGDFAAPKKIVFLVAWLWFYWTDLVYTNRMPSTACRISFWFNFYDCLEISKFSSRTNSSPSSHDTSSLARFILVWIIHPVNTIWYATSYTNTHARFSYIFFLISNFFDKMLVF